MYQQLQQHSSYLYSGHNVSHNALIFIREKIKNTRLVLESNW